MRVVERVHERFVFGRRIEILAAVLADLLPRDADVLDIGCGDGQLALRTMALRPDLSVTGLDVLVRPDAHIEVEAFEGDVIPRDDDSADAVMLVDVLHHTEEPSALLAEAARVARRHVVLKDHTADGFMAFPVLRLMDWVGNSSKGVALPYNYWTRDEWARAFESIQLEVEAYRDTLGLYPAPASWVFERSLHFVARLRVAAGS